MVARYGILINISNISNHIDNTFIESFEYLKVYYFFFITDQLYHM